MTRTGYFGLRRGSTLAALCCLLALGLAACRGDGTETAHRTFGSPEEAAESLAKAVKTGKLEDVRPFFGPDSQVLIDSSDPVAARRRRDVFSVAFAERWRLEGQGDGARTLVIGHEEWPFPIPIVKDGSRWRFDTGAGVEEIVARRIGRNELAVIRLCRLYVAAQRLYAERGHDGRPAGIYAAAFRSEPGKHDGLYWTAARGETRSPLGDLVAAAAAEGRAIDGNGAQPSPFQGYYFRILTAQGESAPGGSHDYRENGELRRGFGLVAWPAQYDVTGVMTFIVNQNGVVHEKDLGPDTDKSTRTMTAYNPDSTWAAVQ